MERLDTRGLRCPLPVLKLRKAMKAVGAGAQIELLSDDPVAAIDVPHFCKEAGHKLVSTQKQDLDILLFTIEKSANS